MGISCQSVDSRRLTPRTTQEPMFPSVLREEDLAAWKIPNKIFCDQMEKTLDSGYLILPWWHHYCQDFKDSKAKKLALSYYHLPIHRAMLDKVQWYRRNSPKQKWLRSWLQTP